MSRSLRQRRLRQRQAQQRRRVILGAIAALSLAAMSAGAYGAYLYLKGPEAWPSITTLQPERIGQNSIIYAADGTRMGVIKSDQNRSIIPIARMGEWAPKAIVSIEDRRFYKHNGVDYEGVARAGVKNLEAGQTVEGGSTITQQVVRNLYKEITAERTLRRKAKEASLAVQLEDRYDKKWILQTYLNLVFFGHNAYGIEAAAQTYFSKHARNLSLPEGALLAGLPQKPTSYDPFRDANAAKTRRNEVLDAMLRDRAISVAEHTKAVASPIRLNPGKLYKERRLPYFFDYVQDQLIKQYGAVTVRQGGLRIHTSISPKMQRLAETSIRETLNQPGDPSAAMVVLDTRTGEIKAMASSENYEASQFNRAAQAERQPGSTAKIWVLASFVKNQINPDTTTYVSRPFKVRYNSSSEWWEPKTYDNSYRGSTSVHSATVASDNSVYAQMTLDISPEEVIRNAHRMGITSKLEPVWSIGLGSQVVTPLEQTNFYSTIARGGVRMDPTAISRVTGPSTTPIPIAKRGHRRVLADWQAKKIVDILHDNIVGGTGTGAYVSAHGSNQAGKTGTTDDHKDAWFCGMTPELTSCVWMGYNTPTPMYSVHGISVAGGTFPATMWKRFMEPALQLVRQREWFTVRGLEVWLPFTSTWQQNPSFDVAVGADPNAVKPVDKDKDKNKDKNKKPAAAAPAPKPVAPAPTPPKPTVPTPTTPTPTPTPPAEPAAPAT